MRPVVKRKTILLLFILFLSSGYHTSRGDTIVVPDDFSRIGDALLASIDGDTILIKQGNYSPSSNNELFPLIIANGVFMVGENRDACIIDSEGTSGVLSIKSLTSSSTRVENLTIRGGFSEDQGGGILFSDSKMLTLRNCHITDNHSLKQGGGIAISSSEDVLIENCVIDSNSSAMWGGGIYCYRSSPSIRNNLFTSNNGELGGGISCFNQSLPVIRENTFEYNTAASQGGGIHCQNNSSPLISQCIFRYNGASKGGGISLQDSSNAWVLDNQFLRNIGILAGGAIFCSNTGETVFKRNLIDDNEAGENGGGICLVSNSEALIDSNTITNNVAGNEEGPRGGGGGIMCYNGPSPVITNNIIQHNETNCEGGGIHMHYKCSGLIENNDIQYNTAGYPGNEHSEKSCGGGIFLNKADVTVRKNIISYNLSEKRTGGIYIENLFPFNELEDVYPQILENTITYNVSNYDAGGIATSHCDSSSIIGNNISNNFAKHGGGAIQLSFGSKTYISNNIIDGNRSEEAGGGAIFICDESKPTICNNTISNNSSSDLPGGAIILLENTSANVTDNLFLNNQGYKGGGIYLRNGARVWVEHNTFAYNYAQVSGGAIGAYGKASVTWLSNNTFFENDSGNRSTMETGSRSYASIENNIISTKTEDEPLIIGDHSRVLIQYNCFWNATGDTTGRRYVGLMKNFYAYPNFVDTLTFDFHLMEGSPCIDAGNPESPLDPDGTIADIGRFYYDQGTVAINPPDILEGKLPIVSLIQNYPNPFNPKTEITLVIRSDYAKPVDMNIYSSRGHLAKHLFNGPLAEGVHRFVWDGNDDKGIKASSGIYFCRVKTEDSDSIIKMILEK